MMVTVKAHFDGQQIQLDEAVALKPNVRLLVTFLDEPQEKSESHLPFPDNVKHLIGCVSGARDLAVNHDYYLHDRPRQEESEDA